MLIPEWYKKLAGERIDDFVLDEYVGCGKIGAVYRSHQHDIPSRTVAIKVVPGQPRPGWENEIRKVVLLADIQGVVHFHQVGEKRLTLRDETNVFLFTVWDYIPPGRNLRQHLKEQACTASFAFAVIEQVLRVLHACATRELPRHGDLHSGNILIGNSDPADVDSEGRQRDRIFVSDFGYGATGGRQSPKDDYRGLAEIFNELMKSLEWDRATATDKQALSQTRDLLTKLLGEAAESDRRPPLEIFRNIREIRDRARLSGGVSLSAAANEPMSVGQFQVAEMLGDQWERWKQLFVPRVPARSRILEQDITTVVTGPRGCGKTMLFRRLSERLTVECGRPDGIPGLDRFVGVYVNANDIADAFSRFRARPTPDDQDALVCYAHLCVLSDILATQAAYVGKHSQAPSDSFLRFVRELLEEGSPERNPLAGEDELERLRTKLEVIKSGFPRGANVGFPGKVALSHFAWLRTFVAKVRDACSWVGQRRLFIFVDDYTIPRVSPSMQRILNRLWFQRSDEFVCKIATEAATTFVPEDASGKLLQDGDDYQMVDLGEESLFMPEPERLEFLEEIFRKRLELDARIPESLATLGALLGISGVTKTEFARRLRDHPSAEETPAVSERRGATRPQALYHGSDTFAALWSGDTRTMIQLLQDLIDEVPHDGGANEPHHSRIESAIHQEIQDRVFRNRGGQWLQAQTRNRPSDRAALERQLTEHQRRHPTYSFAGGSFGSHLKAIVEAFKTAARALLFGPVYTMTENGNAREVPRMAFRIEIVDEFRLGNLAREIYKDLIRYGLFLRDARGKSVRGAMVPRLYLRRLLLPYCTLPLSKRDSVPLQCREFEKLLLYPDVFRQERGEQRRETQIDVSKQYTMPFDEEPPDPRYDDIG
jgi:hypothetical protein